MKATKTFSIAFAVAVAIFVSCAENSSDEVPNNLSQGNNLVSNSLKNGSSKSSGRVEGYVFSGAEGDPIALETAKAWTASYREKNPGDTEAHFFGSEIIKNILAESGCMGIRIYYALDNEGKKQLILVGVDANGENLLPSSLKLDLNDANTVSDFSFPCPPYCPPTSPL